MKRKGLMLALVVGFAACSRDAWQRFPSPDDAIAAVPWFAVMHRGLAIQPYQMPRPPVPGTVPTTGAEPPLEITQANLPAINRLTNPVQRTSASIDNGKAKFDIYCVPCHGDAGHGDGPIVAQFVRPPDLTADPAKGYSDGYLYTMIRSGRGLMPPYGDKVRRMDRWDIVNYLRVLQSGAAAGAPPGAAPGGRP